MSGSVVQCLDCKAWNWTGATECVMCHPENLTPSLSQVYHSLFGAEAQIGIVPEPRDDDYADRLEGEKEADEYCQFIRDDERIKGIDF